MTLIDGYEICRGVLPGGPLTALRDKLMSLPPDQATPDAYGELSKSIRTCDEMRAIARAMADAFPEAHGMIWPPTLRVQQPHISANLVPPHQDVGYVRYLSDFTTAWIPLVPIDDECGGVTLYPKLFDAQERHHGQRSSKWLGALDVGDDPGISPHMEPGDVLLFHRLMIHASRPNTSDHSRLSVDMRFFKEGVECQKPWLNLATMR